MNRNDVVTLDQLVEGDRFYKQSDKKKISMVVMDIISTDKGVLESVTIRESALINNKGNNCDIKLKKPAEYHAVFLRHEVEVA